MRWSRYVLICCLVLVSGEVWAAKKAKGPPAAIAHIYPAGGKVGASFPITVAGQFMQNPTSAWADHPGIQVKATPKPTVFDVTLAPDVPLGPHLLRFFNEDGASPPRIFMVGGYEEIMEKEPNDDFRSPQRLDKIPVTVNGVLERAGDADTYAFHAEAGRWIVLALDGYGLGVQMDPALRLMDEHGVEVVLSHDTYNLDPLIAWQVSKTGTYLVEVVAFTHPPAADITFRGSADYTYRLTITDGPYARSASPAAVQVGHEAELKLRGWNLGPKMEEAQARKLPALDSQSAEAATGTRHLPSLNGETVLAAVVSVPVVTENKPDQRDGPAQHVTLPVAISGRIEAPKDEDRYRFSAKKGETVEFHLHAASLHSPLDPVLQIEDTQGKVLKASNESVENTDPVLKWTAVTDGEYVARVRDLYSRGGWDFDYVLECAPRLLALAATLDANAYKLEPGKTVELKLNVKLTGDFKGKLTARVEGLPEGVTSKELEVPKKGGEVKLTLTAAAEAESANQPFVVTLQTSEPDAPMMARATFDLRGVEPRGDRLINEGSQPWLTVLGK